MLIYQIPVNSDVFSFREYGFPHLALPFQESVSPIRFPFGIRVYLKEKPGAVRVYVRHTPYQHFTLVEEREGYVYEFKWGSPSAKHYLDELQIKTSPSQSIEKIEIRLRL